MLSQLLIDAGNGGRDSPPLPSIALAIIVARSSVLGDVIRLRYDPQEHDKSVVVAFR